MVLDKPSGWILAPDSWEASGRNLQLALTASIRARTFWARSRNLRFIRYVHRLDAETTGLVLFAKSPGAVAAYSELFRQRLMEKRYLAIVRGRPKQREWVCRIKLSPEADASGKISTDPNGLEAETRFKVIDTANDFALIEARPITGRTHQIRVHLAASGTPVLGDSLYLAQATSKRQPVAMALRSVGLSYRDPFRGQRVRIVAETDTFLRTHGFAPGIWTFAAESR